MNDRVLSEFIDAWNAGRRPRVRDYLARLPDGPAVGAKISPATNNQPGQTPAPIPAPRSGAQSAAVPGGGT